MSDQKKDKLHDAEQLAAYGSAAPKREIHIVCQRIRYFRQKKGMEQKALAKELGIICNAVSNWENGRSRPDISCLPKICEILGITLEELFGMPIPSKPEEAQTKAQQSKIQMTARNQLYNSEFVVDTYCRLNKQHRSFVESMLMKLVDAEEEALYDRITQTTKYNEALCAGFSTGDELEGKGEKMFLYDDKIDPNTDCIFPVNGDSMEPDFQDGDLVMVQRLQDTSELAYGEIGAFSIGNELYIKVRSKKGLQSLNKNYGIIKVHGDQTVKIIGRVLGILDPDAIISDADREIYDRVSERMEEEEEDE